MSAVTIATAAAPTAIWASDEDPASTVGATGTPAGGATTPASLRQGIEPAQPGTVHGGAAAVTGMTEGAKIAYVRLAANTTFPIDLRGVTLDEGDAIVAITAVSGNVYVSLFGYWVEK